MANKYNLTGKVVFTSEEAMTLPKSATAPASPVSGDMYYNTTTNEVQIYKDGSWQDVAVGTVSLTDQPLNENEIIVGNASNLSDNVDTDAVGDIRASSDQGLVVKDGVIDDANIATNAAIARSKIASGTANRLVKNDGTGALAELDAITASRALVSDVSGLPVASTVTTTELEYVSGVTSSIQDQLDDKVSSTDFIADGGVQVFSADGTPKTASTTKVIFDTGSTATTLKITSDLANNEVGTMITVFNQTGAIITVTNSADVTIIPIPVRHVMQFVLTSKSPETWVYSTQMLRYSDGYSAANRRIVSLLDPVNAQDAATKNYVDTELADYLPLAGGSMTGNINMGGNNITSLASPTAALDAVNKSYVDALVAGLDFQKDILDVQVDNTLSPSLTLGSRYILTNVSNLHAGFGTITGVANNDIVEYDGSEFIIAYDVSVQGEGALIWNRAADYFMFYDGSIWSEFGGLAGVTAGIGLVKSGNTINVNLGAGIKELPTDEVGIDLYVTSGLMLTEDGTTDSTADAAQLSIKLDGSTLSKSGTGVKIADGGVSDTQIASDAAIQLSKLEALTANKALASNASGEIIATAVTDTELGYVSGVTSSIQDQLDDKASIALDNLANTAVNNDILPATNDTVDLGSIQKNFRNIHSVGFLLGESAVTPAEPESALFLNTSETTLVSEKSLAIRTKDNAAGNSEDIVVSTGAATGIKGNVRVEAGSLILDTDFGVVLQNPDANVSSKTNVASYTLNASTSSFTVISTNLNVTRSVFKSGELHYEVVDSVTDEVRKGKIDFAAGPSTAGFSDTFVSSASALDTAIEFEVTVNAGVVEFKYKNTSSNNCSFRVIRTVVASAGL